MARAPLSLKARALQWLAQREHSRLELRRKLLRAAARADPPLQDDQPIEALLDWLVAERHLSEARFVESRVHARAARFGTRRIAHELAQHGTPIDPAAARQLEATEFERARALWQRRFGDQPPAADAAARAKQMRFLAGRGFASDVIRRVVRGLPGDD